MTDTGNIVHAIDLEQTIEEQATCIAGLEQHLAKLHELGKWHEKLIAERDDKIQEFHQSNEVMSRRIAELEKQTQWYDKENTELHLRIAELAAALQTTNQMLAVELSHDNLIWMAYDTRQWKNRYQDNIKVLEGNHETKSNSNRSQQIPSNTN